MDSPIRIWIGTEEKTNIPCKVLQYSILKHSNSKIEFVTDPGYSWKNHKNVKLGIGTGFSLQRWTIPEKFQYEGFAIYLDADQLVLSDIQELWNHREEMQKNSDISIACTYQKDKWFKNGPATSVMLLECKKALNWQLKTQVEIEDYLAQDKNRKRYVQLMHCQPPLFPSLPLKIDINWNRFNKFVPGTKLLHYTIEPKQPWYDPSHQNKDLWRDYFREALKNGHITKEEVKIELDRFVRPSGCCRGEGLNPYWEKFIK